MSYKKQKLPFDKKGGVIVIPRPMIESDRYGSLSAQAKVLMLYMQSHWKNTVAVGFGVREAAKRIPCAKGTAQNAFRELVNAGFIVMVEESLFNSRTQSKSRTWRLTWMPYMDAQPTRDWAN
tara:strand:- start:198 stop:563 length:366 start_codon:yes stop_codon:yes gene_type:complete